MMTDEWWKKPPMSPTERLRVYGVPSPSVEQLLKGPHYDVRAHYARVKVLYDAYPYTESEACDENTELVLSLALERADRQPNVQVTAQLRSLIDRVLVREGFYRPSFSHLIDEPPTLNWIDLIERPSLIREEQFFANYQEPFSEMAAGLVSFLVEFINHHAPEAAFAEASSSLSSVSFVELARQAPDLLDSLVSSLIASKTSDESTPLFPRLQESILTNLIAASGYTPEQVERMGNPKLVFPLGSDLPLRARSEAYLKETPFLELMLMPLPFDIPDAIRFEHTHLVAGSGHGKTQFLQHMILGYLQRPDPPALIVIDSQGEMLEKIQRLSLFGPGGALADRIVIVDPEDDVSPRSTCSTH
jgi:hypothetical protein